MFSQLFNKLLEGDAESRSLFPEKRKGDGFVDVIEHAVVADRALLGVAVEALAVLLAFGPVQSARLKL